MFRILRWLFVGGSICLLLVSVCLTTAAGAEQAKKVKKAKPAGKAQPDLLEIPQVAKDRVICFALYTVHNGILKLTAQLYPLPTAIRARSGWRCSGTASGTRPPPPRSSIPAGRRRFASSRGT